MEFNAGWGQSKIAIAKIGMKGVKWCTKKTISKDFIMAVFEHHQ